LILPAIALERCFVHGGLFECDPATVVTLYVKPAEPGDEANLAPAERGEPGARQVSVCDPCMANVNKLRAAMGQPPHETAREYAERAHNRGETDWPAGDEAEGWPGI